MATKKLSIYNPETDTSYNLLLGPDDYHKATTDQLFAAALLSHCESNADVRAADGGVDEVDAVDVGATDTGVPHQDAVDENPADGGVVDEDAVDEGATSEREANSDHDNIDSRDSENSLRQVWNSKGKPTDRDKSATRLLLNLRGSANFSKKFDDKKSSHKILWQQIATELKRNGFKVDGVQCRQKFYNLQKAFIKFHQHVRQTGKERKNPPEFYEELHAILAKKDKVTLQNVIDTLPVDTGSLNQSDTTSSPSTSSTIDSIADMVHNGNEQGNTQKQMLLKKEEKVKAGGKTIKITKVDIFNEIKKQNEAFRVDQQNNIQQLIDVLKEDQKQRNEVLHVLKQIVTNGQEQKRKKRRHSSSDSE